MLKAIGLLLIVLMFSLTGCASTDATGKSAAAQSSTRSMAAPATTAGTQCEPSGVPTKAYPPYKW